MNIKEIKILGAGLSCIDIIKTDKEYIMLGGTAANVVSILSLLGVQASFLQAKYIGEDGVWLNNEMKKRKVKVINFNHCKIEAPRFVEYLKNGEHYFITLCPECGKKLNVLKLPQISHIKNTYAPDNTLNLFYYDRVSDGIKWLLENNDCGWNFYEPNSFRVYDTFLKNVRTANIVKLSDERISNKYAEKLKEDLGNSAVQLMIVSLGPIGLKYTHKQQLGNMSEWQYIYTDEMEDVVDSAGAGDWLTAVFLYYFLRVYPYFVDKLDNNILKDCLVKAQKMAALTCLFIGAQGILEDELGIKQINCFLENTVEILKPSRISSTECDYCKR